MSVMKLVLFSVTLKALYASYVVSNFVGIYAFSNCRCYKPSIVKNSPMLIYTDTILLAFAELGSAASVVQTKQLNMKPTNRKKLVA